MRRLLSIRNIDSGGFGIVDEVEDESGTRYARKTFKPHVSIAQDQDLTQKAKTRFIRESLIQSQIKHPHVLPIVETFPTVDPPWFLMPLAGENLAAKITRDRLSGYVDLNALMDVLAGLEELHRLGFVHRDLKPENVLQIEGRWVITDFGLVLPPSESVTTLTGSMSVWGTTKYMAPELVRDFHSALPQTDIYSFGCILHDLVGSGIRVPYSQVSSPGPLGAIIERCTDFFPENRFPDTTSLRNAIVSVLSSTDASSIPEVNDWASSISSTPELLSVDTWTEIVRFIETNQGSEDAHVLLSKFDIVQLTILKASAPTLFSRLVPLMMKWVKTGVFDFAFCDVLVSRLFWIYETGGTREKAEATMAALHLGHSHHRFFVMDQFMRMAGPEIPADLAERLAVEFYVLGNEALHKIAVFEAAIHTSRANLHPRIVEALERIEGSQQDFSPPDDSWPF